MNAMELGLFSINLIFDVIGLILSMCLVINSSPFRIHFFFFGYFLLSCFMTFLNWYLMNASFQEIPTFHEIVVNVMIIIWLLRDRKRICKNKK